METTQYNAKLFNGHSYLWLYFL